MTTPSSVPKGPATETVELITKAFVSHLLDIVDAPPGDTLTQRIDALGRQLALFRRLLIETQQFHAPDGNNDTAPVCYMPLDLRKRIHEALGYDTYKALQIRK